MPRNRTTRRSSHPGAIVHDRLPRPLRRRIDRALAERPDDLKTIADIYRHFRLKEDYAVGITSFRAYARRVENLKRKQSVGRITTRLAPSSPDADATALQDRGRLLLIQRLVRALEDSKLTTAELCRLAQAFTAQRKLALDIDKHGRHRPEGAFGEDCSGDIPDRIVELVRDIYGVRVPRTASD
jgi:hypothetical protein